MPKRASSPSALDLLKQGEWSVDQVSLLLDVESFFVERWCKLRLIQGARWRDGRWTMPGAGLFFFLQANLEPHYSPETVARMLDQEPSTVRSWLKHGRLKRVKLGAAKSAPVLIAESELRRFLDA